MQIFKLLILFLSYTTLLTANDKLTDSLFIGLNMGYIYDKNTIDGPLKPDYKINNDAASYGLELGYRAYENIFYTANYSKYDFESRSFDNFYLSANYIFDLDEEDFSLYVGAVGGWGRVSWTDDPVDSAETSEKRSSNYIIGAQIGLEYVLEENFLLYCSYIYSYSPQKAFLYDTTTIEYSHRHNATIGFRYYLNIEEGKE